MLIVQDNCTVIKSPEDRYAKEDELLNKVYALLDRLHSKEITDRILVIPVVKEVTVDDKSVERNFGSTRVVW